MSARALDIIQGARTDGTPPLFFLLVSAVTRVVGSGEFALRLVSIAAATALVPAIYVITRALGSARHAMLAAVMAVVSPLVHFYAVQARPYALLQLETLLVFLVAYRAARAPRSVVWWVVLALALVVALFTHNYAVFLLPCPVIAAAVSTVDRRAAVVGAVAAVSAAVALDAPLLMRTWQSANAGVGDWIGAFWGTLPPSSALWRSAEVFVGGGQYPPYLEYLSSAPTLRGLAILVAVGLPFLSAINRRRLRNEERLGYGLLWVWLAVPLMSAWVYSLVQAPIYLVGRYDTIVLPVYLIVAAAGLDWLFGVRRWAGVLACATTIGLAVMSSWPALGHPLTADVEDVEAARYLAGQAADGDPIVFTGYRGPVVAYYLSRQHRSAALTGFPSDVSAHPCWFSEMRLLQQPERLDRDAATLVTTLTREAGHAHTVWVLASTSNPIDNRFYTPLLQRFTVDEARSRRAWRLWALNLSDVD